MPRLDNDSTAITSRQNLVIIPRELTRGGKSEVEPSTEGDTVSENKPSTVSDDMIEECRAYAKFLKEIEDRIDCAFVLAGILGEARDFRYSLPITELEYAKNETQNPYTADKSGEMIFPFNRKLPRNSSKPPPTKEIEHDSEHQSTHDRQLCKVE
jgi:hypothetical protein